MNILLVNCILSTAEQGVITKRRSNKDCMIYNFARGFVANGNTVTICASEEFRSLEDDCEDFEVVYFKSKLTKLFRPDLIPFPHGLREFVKKNIDRYDVVIASEVFQVATLLIADICKGKLVIWQELSLHNRMLFKLPSKIWYNFTSVFTAIKDALIIPRSESARVFIKKYFNRVTNEIVEHGANGEILMPVEHANRCFVVVSQLIKRKNIDSIIRTFSDFIQCEEYSDFKLNIIGDGKERVNLERIVLDLGIIENVKILGFLNHRQMSGYLADSYALLVNTSKDLNMVSIPEAIVSGTPVLMNAVPNTAGFVRDNRLGIVQEKWGVSELIAMVENYEEFHYNCIRMRDDITNVGCAKKMIDIFVKYNKTYPNESSSCK